VEQAHGGAKTTAVYGQVAKALVSCTGWNGVIWGLK
jgi:hypothetical protein